MSARHLVLVKRKVIHLGVVIVWLDLAQLERGPVVPESSAENRTKAHLDKALAGADAGFRSAPVADGLRCRYT